MTSPDAQETCSTISLMRDEPLFGSAPWAEVWLLLSYAGPFGSHAFEESDLPDPVKQHLTAELERFPHARLQMIRPDPDQDPTGIEFFVVHAREHDPFYRRIELADYAELEALDVTAILDSGTGAGDEALREPLYLVCTNGRRDPCCAQFGPPVFQPLHDLLGDHVRESSHLAGHRFAANVVLLPHGLCYGRLRPDQVEGLLEAGRQGRMVLESLRGRACYAKSTQAAEVLLRRETGNDELNAYRLTDEQQLSDSSWRIRFKDHGSGAVHQLEIEATTSDEQARVSCWSDKLAPVTRYSLLSYTVAV